MLRFVFAFSVLALGTLESSLATAPPPNFVFILGEGHGWSSTSVQMDDRVLESKSDFVRTPNLERLANEGMRFACFYAPSPRCTPSRVALLTGKSPAQLGITFVREGRQEKESNPANRLVAPPSSTDLPVSEVTIASFLKEHGYAAAHFGKWHMGRINPTKYGFDESDGPTSNGGPENVENPHPKQLYAMTQQGVDFMARQVKSGKPFYLEISHYPGRQGGAASPEALQTVKSWGLSLNDRESNQAAADLDLDIALGMLLKRLDELDIRTNTYVIFTTDHGSPGRNRPLAGGKGAVSEGGLRVPLIIRGPGIEAGTCSHVRAFGVDLFPTIAALSHSERPLPSGLEGGSLLPLLLNKGSGVVARPFPEYVVHFPHYDMDLLGPASAIYVDDLKLIRRYETGALDLFDITKDPGEAHNLARQMPDKAADLGRRLTSRLSSLGAALPQTNSAYAPGHSAVARRGRQEKP